jgi:hypothetical protein
MWWNCHWLSFSRWIKRKKDNYYKIAKILLLNSIKVSTFLLRVFYHKIFSVECLSVKEITKWSQFEPIYEKLQKVIDVEKGRIYFNITQTIFFFTDIDLSKSNSIWNRTEHIDSFLDWLHSNNVDTSNFQICSFDNYGFGLKATKNLAVIYSIIFFCQIPFETL